MNNAINHSKPPGSSSIWHLHLPPVHWDHRHEAIAHALGAALRRCFKGESREVA